MNPKNKLENLLRNDFLDPALNLLAIDTSTPAVSVALRVDNTPNGLSQLGQAKHTEVLLPMIEELLSDEWLSVRDLDGIILSAGPGAFTGLRVGASVVAGLAIAYQIPIGCLSSLALLAGGEEVNEEQPQKILALLDARMQQCYAGFYQQSREGLKSLGKDYLCAGIEIPLNWLEDAGKIIGAGAVYLAPEYQDKANNQIVPDASHAFSLLHLVQWQPANQVIDLRYLRNEVTY